jgi:hypothetical protein
MLRLPKHVRRYYTAEELTPGFKGRRITFEYRRYEERSPEARESYDALRADLEANGMRNPLITYQGHVLIGMRRFEIMCERGQRIFPCIEILEDVSEWWQDGPPKLAALKRTYYGEEA